jgi:hypothetical protein
MNMKKNIIVSFFIFSILGCQKEEQKSTATNNEVFLAQGKWEINDSQCTTTGKDTVIVDSSYIQYLSSCYCKEKYSFKLLSNSKIEFETTEFDWYYSKNSMLKIISPYRVISKNEFVVDKMLGSENHAYTENPEDNRTPIIFKRIK